MAAASCGVLKRRDRCFAPDRPLICLFVTRSRKPMKAIAREIRPVHPMLGWIVFLLIALTGLFYVKWFPYYNRAFLAAANHSIGSSILMGTAASPPTPSWDAALNYALAYGKAIWQAMVLGLLLGSAVQALLPARWIARSLKVMNFPFFSRFGYRSVR